MVSSIMKNSYHLMKETGTLKYGLELAGAAAAFGIGFMPTLYDQAKVRARVVFDLIKSVKPAAVLHQTVDSIKSVGLPRASIFPHFLSPFFEEIVKGIMGSSYLIGLLDALVNREPLLFLLHAVTYAMSLPMAIATHYGYNYLIAGISNNARAKDVLDLMYNVPWSMRSLPSGKELIPYDIKTGFISRQATANYIKPAQCPLMVAKDKLLDSELIAPRVYYAIMATNVPGYAVRVTPSMIRAAMECRVLKVAPKDPEQQAVIWDAIEPNYGIPHQEDIPVEEATEAWLTHVREDLPQKWKKYAQVYEKLLKGEDMPLSHISVFLKTDEVLLKPDFMLKPRIIANVPSSVQVMAGPFIRYATARLKDIWNNDNIKLPKFPNGIRLSFGAGRDDNWLSSWIVTVENTPLIPAIMAAGDDSIVFNGTDWYCCDASAYDQSQSFGPLRHAYKIYQQLCVPPAVTELLDRVSRLPYRYDAKEYGSFKIYRKNRPIRDTGGPDTTLGNTINMVAAWMYVLSEDPTNDTYKPNFNALVLT